MDTSLTTWCSWLETFSRSYHLKVETQIFIWLSKFFKIGPLPNPCLSSGPNRAGRCPSCPSLISTRQVPSFLEAPPNTSLGLLPILPHPAWLHRHQVTRTMHRGPPTLVTPHLGTHDQVMVDKLGHAVARAENVAIHVPTDHVQTHRGLHSHTQTRQHSSGGMACGHGRRNESIDERTGK